MVVFLTIPNLGQFNETHGDDLDLRVFILYPIFTQPIWICHLHASTSFCIRLITTKTSPASVLCQPTHIKSVDGTRCPILWELNRTTNEC